MAVSTGFGRYDSRAHEDILVGDDTLEHFGGGDGGCRFCAFPKGIQ